MGISSQPQPDTESALLLSTTDNRSAKSAAPADKFHFAYIIHFTLGVGFLLPWNAFITAVDYFSYIYPDVSVDRIFAVAYFLCGLFSLIVIVFYAHKSDAYLRINVGLVLFVAALLVVPVMDGGFIMGRVGLYGGFYVTVGALGVCGLADALVQGGLIGAAGELPERYMQAIIAGTAGSGVLVSFLRIFTKAMYSQDSSGLRNSANLYFIAGIVVMAICIVFYNVAHRLPVMQYYADAKKNAINEEIQDKGSMTGSEWRSSLLGIVGSVKWHGTGMILIYLVTLAIFPGYVTEDVKSEALKDWTEIPVTVLTGLLGLTNGYLTSVLMILASKSVPLHQAETAGIVMVLFLTLGLASGSIVAWFWVV